MTTDKQYPDVWVFDECRRVYRRDENGNTYGSPIWREHWRKLKIVGETRVSWISSYGDRIPKKGGRMRLSSGHFCDVSFSEADIDRQAWVKENRYLIADIIRCTTDHDTLRRVAEVIGYIGVAANG